MAVVFSPSARNPVRAGQASVNQAQTYRCRTTGAEQQAQMNVYRYIHRLQDPEKNPKMQKPLQFERNRTYSELLTEPLHILKF
jgi:hypothetical protein